MEVIIAVSVITVMLGSLIAFYFIIRHDPKRFLSNPRRRRKNSKKK